MMLPWCSHGCLAPSSQHQQVRGHTQRRSRTHTATWRPTFTSGGWGSSFHFATPVVHLEVWRQGEGGEGLADRRLPRRRGLTAALTRDGPRRGRYRPLAWAWLRVTILAAPAPRHDRGSPEHHGGVRHVGLGGECSRRVQARAVQATCLVLVKSHDLGCAKRCMLRARRGSCFSLPAR